MVCVRAIGQMAAPLGDGLTSTQIVEPKEELFGEWSDVALVYFRAMDEQLLEYRKRGVQRLGCPGNRICGPAKKQECLGESLKNHPVIQLRSHPIAGV
mmetsp:Transcript_45152/g.61212  ORF Transcript_45152/g.61212 Transcript_45152/m.61212 type:complete len:98 (-) Transcript_45152:1552-1845(-)